MSEEMQAAVKDGPNSAAIRTARALKARGLSGVPLEIVAAIIDRESGLNDATRALGALLEEAEELQEFANAQQEIDGFGSWPEKPCFAAAREVLARLEGKTANA